MKKIIIVFVVCLLTAGVVYANSKYFKEEDTLKEMQSMSASLGVNCSYCHVSDKSVTIENRDKYDIEKDFTAMRHKDIAHAMMGMQKMFNDKNGTSISCMTCHQGEIVPEL